MAKTNAPSTRMLRVARELQKELSELLQHDVENLRNLLVSVTQVKVTPDLQLAKVYLTVMPEAQQRATVHVLNAEQVALRQALARRMRHRMRVTPELKFFEDDTLQEAARIEQLLDKLHIPQDAPAGDQATDAPQGPDNDQP